MKKLIPSFCLLTISCLLLSGCPAALPFLSPASGQNQVQQLQTSTLVHLNGQNYRIIKTNITGTDWGFNLLGLVTLVSPNYVKAVKQLYKEGGITEGRAIALANVAQQDTSPYFILFSLPRITLRADVIEFTGPVPPTGVPTPQAQGVTTPGAPSAAPAAMPPPITAPPFTKP
jgi:hypothetical protein